MDDGKADALADMKIEFGYTNFNRSSIKLGIQLTLVNRSGNFSLRTNRFLLSLLSPVLRGAFCGGFKEAIEGCMVLEDIDSQPFIDAIELACGRSIEAACIADLLELARIADRCARFLIFSTQ